MAMPKMSSRTGGNGGGNGHCPHHWMIEAARGETSKGYCLFCGEMREFKNSMPSKYQMADPAKSAIGGRRKNGGANSIAYIPVLREFEGGIY